MNDYMEHAIEQAAETIWKTSRADEGTISATGAKIIARALAEAGLLAPAPLREEWAAAWEGHGATRIGFAQESPEDIEGVPPGGWVVRRHVSDWLSVDRAEGDGRADQ